MSHTIKARIPGRKTVVAELRITGRRKRETKLYAVLGVPEFHALDSGNGKSKFFRAEFLGKAKGNFLLNGDERNFIELCHIQGKTAGGTEIEFA